MVPNLRSVMNSSVTINTGLCTYSQRTLGRQTVFIPFAHMLLILREYTLFYANTISVIPPDPLLVHNTHTHTHTYIYIYIYIYIGSISSLIQISLNIIDISVYIFSTYYERINKKICRQKISIMFNDIYIYIYIYIYIVIYKLSFSLYHNSSVLLDTQDASSWDRNPGDFTSVGYLTHSYRHSQQKRRNFCTYILTYTLYKMD